MAYKKNIYKNIIHIFRENARKNDFFSLCWQKTWNTYIKKHQIYLLSYLMHLKNTIESQENPSKKSSHKLATAALIFSLLMTPAIENWNTTISAQDTSKSTQTEQVEPTKHINTVSTEHIIKKSVKQTLVGMKKLEELPKKINYGSFDATNLPQTMDINPKKISNKQPVPFITVTLWTRSFRITPIIGKIHGIELNSKELVLYIGMFWVSRGYSRDKDLPKLFRELWNKPCGKWEKDGFDGTIVTEV